MRIKFDRPNYADFHPSTKKKEIPMNEFQIKQAIENAVQETEMSQEEIATWDKLMMCESKVSLEDLMDNIMITEERMGITDRTTPEYWKYVAKYVLSLYDDNAVGDRYKRLEKFKEDYDWNKRINTFNKAVSDLLKIEKEKKALNKEMKSIEDDVKNDSTTENVATEKIKTFGVDAKEALSHSYYMQTVPDSHSFSALEQIKESLRILKSGYIIAPIPSNKNGFHLEWPPISIEHMQKGIDNTIKNGYKMVLDSQIEEQNITNEEIKQLKEWMDDLNVPKKEIGKNGQEYSLMGRVIQLLHMIQLDFQNITSSGILGLD